MQKLAKSAILLLWLACEAAASSTFVLETGEIIKGVVLTKTAENVEVRTAYGDIKIPYTAIKTETVDAPHPLRTPTQLPKTARPKRLMLKTE